MATWYRTKNWYSEDLVIPVEIVRDTERFVIIRNEHGREGREAKDGYHNYFPTEAEAWTAVLDKATRDYGSAKSMLDDAESVMSKATAALRKLTGVPADEGAFPVAPASDRAEENDLASKKEN